MDKIFPSGSLGVKSGNIMSIPKISIALSDYVEDPFSPMVAAVKGHSAHGWMGEHQPYQERIPA